MHKNKSMKIIRKPSEMQELAINISKSGKSIGLVPTMGALHNGHLSLVDVAKKESDICVVSIFVNPTQFGPNEDFSNYPRQLEMDAHACELRGVDIVFAPEASDIYSSDFSTYINEENISQYLCGKSRPKHFRGVTTIVGILFNIIRPNVAVFGEKDAQQVSVIRKMTKDLFFDVKIITAPLIRESNGLAMSSRNKYLSGTQTETATQIHKALEVGKKLVEGGCTNIDRVKGEIVNYISKHVKIRIIYVEIVDAETSIPVQEITQGKSRATIAVWLDNVRLIDNIIL